jgi:hypothetical protein
VGLGSLGSIEANETGTPKLTPHILAERHVVFDLVVVSRHALGAPTKPEVKNTLWTVGMVFEEVNVELLGFQTRMELGRERFFRAKAPRGVFVRGLKPRPLKMVSEMVSTGCRGRRSRLCRCNGRRCRRLNRLRRYC